MGCAFHVQFLIRARVDARGRMRNSSQTMTDDKKPPPSTPAALTHLDAQGLPRMVDVSAKSVTARRAIARGRLSMSASGWQALASPEGTGKGSPLAVAHVAAVQAAKRTADWIPLAHPLPIAGVEVAWTQHDALHVLEVAVAVTVDARTGVEMEALTACSAALLTVYDMLKAVDRGMRVGPIWLARKEGGRSGLIENPDPPLISA